MKIAVGFFDGLHLGHQEILRTADAVMTFRNHPLTVLAPDRRPVLLMSEAERLAAIRRMGIGEMIVLDFTRELANTEPGDFLKLALSRVGDRLTAIRCGEQWRFGRGGRGDVAFLRASGLVVESVPCLVYAGERISSTRIRACLAGGLVEEAAAMLGRPYSLTGSVVPGKGLGRKLGFPTVNVRPGRPVALRRGVYAVEALGRPAVANFGFAPTLGEEAWSEPTLEVHFLDSFDQDGLPLLAVSFRRFLRPEMRFSSTEELVRRLADDRQSVQRIFSEQAAGNLV